MRPTLSRIEKISLFLLTILGILTLGALYLGTKPPQSSSTSLQSSMPIVCGADNAVNISIAYNPVTPPYMPEIMASFNQAYVDGKNPLNGKPLAANEKPICITGKEGSSGTLMQGIVNAVIAPTNTNVEKPTIFQPAVSHWLTLANYYSNKQLCDPATIRQVARSPVVIAIWERRLAAIRNTVGYDDIGWEELLQVLNSPNGWQDYGIPNGRRTVFYGHTDPYISSTGLSTLIAEFYASARQKGFTGRTLDMDTVNREDVQQGVRDIEGLIRHYASRTTEFKNYIAQGPDYVDFVALPEYEMIPINQGKTEFKPPEKLVALYPKEGTFWHESPVCTLSADWVTPEQHDAAEVFTNYLLTPAMQQIIMSRGFRPANPDVTLTDPIIEANGISLKVSTSTLDVPAPEVVAAIQQSWSIVKKQADIMLLIDVSGSMSGDKLDQAKQATLAFLDRMESRNRVGLRAFNSSMQELVPLSDFEGAKQQLKDNISRLGADGGTALYDSLLDTVRKMNDDKDENRIRAIVVLSDGADSNNSGVPNELQQAIQASRDALNPLIVIPVAYGSDADIQVLNAIAHASHTQMVVGDPQNILNVLNIISSYF